MSNRIELLPGEPILIQTLSEEFDYRADMPGDIEQIQGIFDQQSQPIFMIIDARKISIGLDDMTAAASMVTRQSNLFKHPNMLEGIIVTESRMIELAVKGMSSPIFGSVKLRVFHSVEEALEYARQNASLRDAM